MSSYKTWLIFVYFLIIWSGQSTLNSCIRIIVLEVVYNTIYLEKSLKVSQTKIIGWVTNFSFCNFILIIIIIIL